jgi:hypothetical protein
MLQQLCGYKVEEKLYLGVREQKTVEYHCPKIRTYLGVREQKRLNTTALRYVRTWGYANKKG